MTKAMGTPRTGRISKYSASKVGKLQAAFGRGFNVDQACIYADISKPTFYAWLEKKPEFLNLMTAAREQPTMRAKQVVVDSIDNGNSTDAKWWLERRAPEEFAPNSANVTVNNNFINVISKDRDEFSVIDAV